jgi:hypothetical protein
MPRTCPETATAWRRRALTPEEDSIGDPGDEDNEIDDLLPADLWFRAAGRYIYSDQGRAH